MHELKLAQAKINLVYQTREIVQEEIDIAAAKKEKLRAEEARRVFEEALSNPSNSNSDAEDRHTASLVAAMMSDQTNTPSSIIKVLANFKGTNTILYVLYTY